MSWMPWRKAQGGRVGVEIGAESIAFAYVDGADADGAESKQLKACELLLPTDGELPLEALHQRVEQLGLQGTGCNLVLPANLYNLMLVEAPNVPAEEMRDAVRFRIKDMIPFPVKDALIDTFFLPEDSSRSGRRMIYVVVAEESRVKALIDMIGSAGLKLESIDIAELALRNLTEKLPEDNRGAALVRILPGQGMLALLRGGQLYLSRQFELNYNGGLLDDLPEEQLVLELQRSLDYYERQMGQVPPGSIYLCGENVSDDKVGADLNGGVAASISTLQLGAMLEVAPGIDEAVMQMCATAIGGALRSNA